MIESVKCDEVQLRVRYGETDQMGVVYHGNYAQYFEIGRVEWLRKLGVSYRQMEENGIMLPVISMNVKFIKPARYDDMIKVKTQLVKLPSATIEFEYEIFNQNNELLVTGNTSLVFIDVNRNKPTRCPQYLLDQLHD